MLARRSWPLVAATALLAATPALATPTKAKGPAGASSAPGPRPGARPVVAGAVPLAFMARPRADGTRRIQPARATVPVVVRYARPVTARDREALRALGATDVEAFRERRGLRARLLLADVPASALASIEALDAVERVSLDGSPFAAPRPLDFTTAQTQAVDVWRTRGQDGLPIDGHGMVVCDIDSGIDPFHPLFFRADGNGGKPYVAWIDVDGDGKLTPGVDGVDLLGDGKPVVLRVLNSTTTKIHDSRPLFGTSDPALDPGFDYLYADTDDSGAREHGPGPRFDETTPTYGEPLFLVDDVNGDDVLDVHEKLVALGTSKIRAARFDKKVYRRGQNLIDLPVTPEAYHGTGAAGVLVAGTPGLTELCGMAPGADVVMATNNDGTSDLKLAKFCHDEGARVVLHEYAPWFGHALDGSSELEQYIDETSPEGISHVNPAGNLSGSDKAYKHTIAPGATTDVLLEAPAETEFGYLAFSLLWRDPSRDLVIVVEDPNGVQKQLPELGKVLYEPWGDDLTVYAYREDSERGTARFDFYLFDQNDPAAPIPSGTWHLHVTDPSDPAAEPMTLFGYVADDVSGWGKGIHFPEHATEEHYIGYPGTADHGMAIAAYTGHGYWGAEPDLRAPYSGRGKRIDGAPILWISAPDDPVTSGTRPNQQSLHVIYGGTSGASPHVAGAAVLLLSQNPTWTGDDVKEAIRKGAHVDDAVLSAGPVPNTDYGHGKLRVHESLYGKPPAAGAAPTLKIAELTVEQHDTARVVIDAKDADEPASALTLEIDRDYDGTFEEPLAAPEILVPTDNLGTVVSKVRVTDATGRTAAALAVVHVVEVGSLPEPEPEPDPDDEPKPTVKDRIEAVGGGGCSVPVAPTGSLGGALLGLLSLLGLRRRRTTRS